MIHAFAGRVGSRAIKQMIPSETSIPLQRLSQAGVPPAAGACPSGSQLARQLTPLISREGPRRLTQLGRMSFSSVSDPRSVLYNQKVSLKSGFKTNGMADAPASDDTLDHVKAAGEALRQALDLLDAADSENEPSPNVQAASRSKALVALQRFVTVAQDAQGELCADATAQIESALVKMNQAGKNDPRRSVTATTLLDRLQSSMTAGMVAFGVISYWRGVWFLWDGLVFPEDPLTSGIASAAVGLGVLMGARAFDVALAPPLTRLNQVQSDADKRQLPIAKPETLEKSESIQKKGHTVFRADSDRSTDAPGRG